MTENFIRKKEPGPRLLRWKIYRTAKVEWQQSEVALHALVIHE